MGVQGWSDISGRCGAVLLAAGRGSRLSELTDRTHKSLLDIGGRSALGRILAALSGADVTDIVVVTGYRSGDLRAYIGDEHPEVNVTFAHNPAWARDTNILSTQVGVSALSQPEDGYLIIETDIALDQAGWERVLSTSTGEDSICYTKGRYSRDLTGGCLTTDPTSRVTQIAYAPKYDEAHEGWAKRLGVLYVAPAQVRSDRRLRERAIKVSTKQYYFQPYVDHLDELPCMNVDLGDALAMSFNDIVGVPVLGYPSAPPTRTR